MRRYSVELPILFCITMASINSITSNYGYNNTNHYVSTISIQVTVISDDDDEDEDKMTKLTDR